jgi:hypothetical protein
LRRTSRLNDSVDRQWGEFARLVSRRGDEANDQIGIARAAFFPSLVLGARFRFYWDLVHELVQLAQSILGCWTGDVADYI